jgi:hypothetical protein
MNGYDAHIDELHERLSRLYRTGSRDRDAIAGLWARIERLEAGRATHVQVHGL